MGHRTRWGAPAGAIGVLVFGALGLAACGLFEKQGEPAPLDLITYVDPLQGTGGPRLGANVNPGPVRPFGMIWPGPHTYTPGDGGGGPRRASGYDYNDTHIAGFGLAHLPGVRHADLATLTLMPTLGISAAQTTPAGYAASFSHANEEAFPGYYGVRLDNGIEVRIASEVRRAVFEFAFPEGNEPILLLDPIASPAGTRNRQGGVSHGPPEPTERLDGCFFALHEGELTGPAGGLDLWSCFVADPPPATFGVWDAAGLHPGRGMATGDEVGGWIGFAPGITRVRLEVTLSFRNTYDGAVANFSTQLGDSSVDSLALDAVGEWDQVYSGLRVFDADEATARLLATALHRTYLSPSASQDQDTLFLTLDGMLFDPDCCPERGLSNFLMWDTYRTHDPWLSLFDRFYGIRSAMGDSLMVLADEAHGATHFDYLPRTPIQHRDVHYQVGDPAIMVYTDLASHGAASDAPAKFRQQYDQATSIQRRREGWLDHGFVPADLAAASVAKTLEYSLGDHALVALGDKFGTGGPTGQLPEFRDRAANAWRQVFNPETGFFQPRASDGAWVDLPDPLAAHEAYADGNAWQWLWWVPHDLDGLAEVMGGRDAALARLRTFFESSAAETPGAGGRVWFNPDRAPCLIAPWLFAAWGRPAEAAQWIDWTVRTFFRDGPDGAEASDVGGSRSAWLLYAHLGIYPLPGTGRYLVAAPRLPRVEVEMTQGRLTVVADPDPRTHPVPLSVSLDGAPLASPYLDTWDLTRDEHTLSFTMGR
jgi:putative alpha-1,2-mannosidase